MSDSLSHLELIASSVGLTGGALKALRDISEHIGYVSEEALVDVANAFNLSKAEVRGIVSFYTDVRTEPPARNIVKVCTAEACQSVGCRALQSELEAKLGVEIGATHPSKEITFEAVSCLGLCSNGPAAMVNDQLLVEVTADMVIEQVGGEG